MFSWILIFNSWICKNNNASFSSYATWNAFSEQCEAKLVHVSVATLLSSFGSCKSEKGAAKLHLVVSCSSHDFVSFLATIIVDHFRTNVKNLLARFSFM